MNRRLDPATTHETTFYTQVNPTQNYYTQDPLPKKVAGILITCTPSSLTQSLNSKRRWVAAWSTQAEEAWVSVNNNIEIRCMTIPIGSPSTHHLQSLATVPRGPNMALQAYWET